MIETIPNTTSVQIRDYKIIKKADIKFTQGLNIITGKNASGKSTVLEYLKDSLSHSQRLLLDIQNELHKSTIVIDTYLEWLNSRDLLEALTELSNCNRQVMITLEPSQVNKIKSKIKANIIDTKDFELRE